MMNFILYETVGQPRVLIYHPTLYIEAAGLARRFVNAEACSHKS
ncbi:hypothetical protein C2W59_02555 [Bacillus pumilus]|nr:hypothetical protein C2W59_02555 [Bacillus pumilus]